MNKSIKQIFSNNLIRFLKRQNERPADLARSLEVNQSTVSMWIHAKKMPRSGMLQKISHHFRVNISDLTSEQLNDKSAPDISNNNQILNFEGKPVTEDERRYIEATLKAYRQLKKQNKNHPRH